MAEKTVAQKMFIKEGETVLLVNAPKGYRTIFGLPRGAKLVKTGKEIDVIQVFVETRKEMETQLPKLRKMLNPKGSLWLSYRKGSTAAKIDINRDTIYAYANTLGLEGVSLIAVDKEWSSMRFKAAYDQQ